MKHDNRASLWPEGRNLLRYDRDETVLSDFHSPVAIGAWNADEMGITQLHFQGYVPASEHEVLDPMLRIFVRIDDEWQPVPVFERTCWPGGWVETGRVSGAEITQKVWFSCHNELRVNLHVIPLDGANQAVQLAFGGGHAFAALLLAGEVRADGLCVGVESSRKKSDGTPEFRADMHLRTEPFWTACRFRKGPSQNSLPPAKSELTDESTPSADFGYWIELPAISFNEQETAKAELTFNWTFSNAAPPAPSKRYEFEENINRWRELIERLPLPEGNMYWRRKGAVAVADLLTSLIQSPGYGNMADKLGIGARTLRHLSHSYFWDTMTTVPALAEIEPDWGAQVIENFTQHIGSHDCPPFAISAFPNIKGEKRSWRGSQAPIAGWAVQKHAECTGKTDLVSRLYPELKKINDSWFEHADPDGNGIPVWVNTGAAADDSPLYDMYAGARKWHNIYLPPIASTCLCSYLLMDMRCLEKMAHLLGKKDDEQMWREKTRAFDRKMLDLLWDDEEKIFYDRDLTIYRPNKVKTFFNLLPLWAGISLAEDDARAAIERHLLNPEEMWGEVPFPSVAYNEPTYDPMGYWRGRGWPHIYFWNSEILAKYGYTAEANEAKRRFLSMTADAVDIPENFVSTIRTGSRRDHGAPHYSWGLATTLYFLWDWHLKPLS